MKIQISNFKVTIENKDKTLEELVSKKYKFNKADIKELIVSHESIDARDKANIILVYSLILDITDSIATKLIKDKNIKKYINNTPRLKYTSWSDNLRPVIVGFGPAGIFAALYLTRCNAKPIIIERGSDMDKRIEDVKKFIENKELDENSNIQFGEGGAGTFSDGKLQTNASSPLISYILNEFVRYGAPKDIIYKSHPHIGTDYLRKVIKNMREDMILRGATFYFNTKFEEYDETSNSIIVKTNTDLEFETHHLILGLGHSARDTFEMLNKHNLNMEPKSFSMGVRIEHTREDINKIQFGEFASILPAASYKMAVHLENRSVYTFCMCPGGEVVASASEKNSIVTNGMSYYDRSNQNSNGALLVNVDPSDFYKDSVLDGLRYQEKYERLAFEISKDYKAPANLVKEFLNDEVASSCRSVKPSYPHSIKFANLSECLPEYVIKSLKEALPLFDKKMHGFLNDDAILTGIESRSSCPLRIIRDENKKSSNKYIYPIGEGAGYAGGITTAALDGLKTAMSIMGDEI